MFIRIPLQREKPQGEEREETTDKPRMGKMGKSRKAQNHSPPLPSYSILFLIRVYP
jgi:hypothetical protein